MYSQKKLQDLGGNVLFVRVTCLVTLMTLNSWLMFIFELSYFFRVYMSNIFYILYNNMGVFLNYFFFVRGYSCLFNRIKQSRRLRIIFIDITRGRQGTFSFSIQCNLTQNSGVGSPNAFLPCGNAYLFSKGHAPLQLNHYTVSL